MPAAIAIPLIVAGVGAGASVYAAHEQTSASNNAAAASRAAADKAAGIESSNFDKSIAAAQDEQDYNRWLTQATAEARQPYLDALAESIGAGFGSYAPSTYTPQTYTAPTYEAAKPFVEPTAADLEKDPGFQFEKQQGVDTINRTGAARGTLLTGGTLKDAESFGQGLAATRLGERQDRALQEYSLAETLRSQAFDRNAANQFNAAQFNNQSGFNAAQLNNQSAYQAASLGAQGVGQRLSALSSLASLALPTGAYPGAKRTGTTGTIIDTRNGGPGGAVTDPGADYVRPIDIGDRYAPSGDPNSLYGDENQSMFGPDGTAIWNGTTLRRRSY